MIEFDFIDKSNYLRGLLILVGKDNIISERERKRFLKIGKDLGFESKFCKDSLNDFLSNTYVDLSPPKFKNIEVAKKFIVDAIEFAFSDNEIFVEVLEWINNIATINNVNNSWMNSQIRDYSNIVEENQKIVNSNI